MRFFVPRRELLSASAVERAYLAGMDGVPWRSRNQLQQDYLVLEREEGDSGNLHIPWTLDGFGEIVVSSGSLMERGRTYNLEIELARGALNRLRNQAADWEAIGLVVPESHRETVRQSLHLFARAATAQSDPRRSAEEAERSLRLALDGLVRLGKEYVRQLLEFRHQSETHFATLLAANVGHGTLTAEQTDAVVTAFNTVALPFSWRELEPTESRYEWARLDKQVAWLRGLGMRVCGGPLIVLDRSVVPDWMYLWEEDFDDVRSYAVRYVEAVVGRYQGKVQLWHCAARLNRPGALSLTEEQRLQLAVSVIETVRRVDPRTPVIMSFDQPWAEYQANTDCDLSPIHFADALARSELGVAGIGLEINFGYGPGGTLVRDAIDISRQIDRWSLLGLPLLVLLTAPSGDADDPRAGQPSKPLKLGSNGASLDQQKATAEMLVPMLLAKRTVHGIIWNQLSDAEPHDYPHGGLFDATGAAKPVLSTLTSLRQLHLK